MDDDRSPHSLPGHGELEAGSASRFAMQVDSSHASLPSRPPHAPPQSLPVVAYGNLTPALIAQYDSYLDGMTSTPSNSTSTVTDPGTGNRAHVGAVTGRTLRADVNATHVAAGPLSSFATSPSTTSFQRLAHELDQEYQRYLDLCPLPSSTGTSARPEVEAAANAAAMTSQTLGAPSISAVRQYSEGQSFANIETPSVLPEYRGSSTVNDDSDDDEDVGEDDDDVSEFYEDLQATIRRRELDQTPYSRRRTGVPINGAPEGLHEVLPARTQTRLEDLAARHAILMGHREASRRRPTVMPTAPPSATATSPSYANSEAFLAQGVVKHEFTVASGFSIEPPSKADRDCPICYEPYGGKVTRSNEDAVRITACGHVFGRKCLETHVASGQPSSRLCPMCRSELWRSGAASFRSRHDFETMRLMRAWAAMDNKERMAIQQARVQDMNVRRGREQLRSGAADATGALLEEEPRAVELMESLQTSMTNNRPYLAALMHAAESRLVQGIGAAEPSNNGAIAENPILSRMSDTRRHFMAHLATSREHPLGRQNESEAEDTTATTLSGSSAVSGAGRAAQLRRVLSATVDYDYIRGGLELEDVDMLLEEAAAAAGAAFSGSGQI